MSGAAFGFVRSCDSDNKKQNKKNKQKKKQFI